MLFGVLGPLEVRVDSRQLTIKGVKERRLLGLLLSRANSVVPVGEIIEALWGTEPPPSAGKSVQVYVVRVRKMLSPDGGVPGDSVVSRRGSGYVLGAARDQVDALQFADLLARGREAAAAGAHDVAALILRDALGLWRGAPYADFQDTWFGSKEAAHLGEMRLFALEARVDADLALGRHAEVTAELEALVREHPLRERFWALLMLALYRGGRQSDALLAFRRARSRLVAEIGVEPGPELRALEAAVLAHDPGLAAPDLRSSGPPELPDELRGTGPVFAGRDAVVSSLRRLWAEAELGHGGVVLVSGPAGSGRTRLAAELARHAQARGAVVHLARSGLAESDPAGLVRSAGARPVLLVLDGADRCGPDAAALLEAAAEMAPGMPLLALATYDPAHADARLHAVELRAGHARRLGLAPLDDGYAAFIVQRYLGPRAEPDAVKRIVAQAHGLPGRLHELAATWMEQDAFQRVADAVSQAPAARHTLSSVRATVRDGVLDLHRVKEERGALAGAGVALCPYKGLARFEREDAAIFHGREALVATLVARLADTPLVAVVGPSGAGKSSVVRAGLLPALADGVLPGSGDWPQHVLTPGRTPRRSLAPLLDGASGQHAVVVIDQFEELFGGCGDEAGRAGFVADLLGLLDRDSGRVRVVLTLRADFLGWCAAYPALASRIGDGAVLVAPMTDEEVRRAVTGPARYAGLSVEEDLPGAVTADVRGRPGGLPLLSVALLDTWERRRGRTLTHAGYLAAGGVSGALARLGDAAYAKLDAAGQQAARRILVRLAETGEAGVPVRRRVPAEEVAAPGDAAARRALEVLVARRLVTAGDGTVEVAHEALLSHWPRLARWLEEDEQGRALRRHLAPAAREWAASGRPAAELYRGARLASALDWAAGHGGDLNPLEAEFLEASRAAAERELREQKERADREARARRRLRVVLAGVVALLLLAAAAGAVAVQQRGAARAAQRSAEARRLGARALIEPHLDRSLLLAAAAERTDPSLETDGDLLAALLRSPYALRQVRGDGDRLQDVVLSPDGRILAAGDNDGTLMFWDTRTMRPIGKPVELGTWSGRLAFAPDSRRLAVVSQPTPNRWEVVVWDVAGRRVLRRMPDPTEVPGFPAWSGDGRTVVAGSSTGVVVYNAATGRETGRVKVPGASSSAWVNAFTAGRKVMAVAAQGKEVLLVDPATARVLRRVVLPVPAPAAGISPDGRTLAVGTLQGTVLFTDLTSGRVRHALTQHTARVEYIAFSPDGRTAASTSDDGTAMVWDAGTGQRRLTLQGHAGPVLAGVFARDGQTLYTTGLDASVIAWDIAGRRSFGVTLPDMQPGPFPVNHLAEITYLAWPASRRRAVIGWPQGTVAAIDTSTGKVTARGRPANELEDLAVSPDGRFAYIVSDDGKLRRWDTALGKVDMASTLDAGQPDYMVTISPDGRTLAVATQDGAASFPVIFVDTRTLHRIGPRINPGYKDSVPLSRFSPDGRLLALGSSAGPGLAVADVRTGRIRWANPSISQVLAIGFSPDGRYLAAGTGTGAIETFGAASGHRLAGPTMTEAAILAASYAPDGRTILSSGMDGTVRLWEASSLRPVGKPIPAADDIWVFAAFSPDGSQIIALDITGRVLTWPATAQAWLHHACSIVGRDFTPQERTLYSITSISPKPCT